MKHIKNYRGGHDMMTDLEKVFANADNHKLTENGDDAFKSTNNPLVDILFGAPYLEKNLNEVSIGTSDLEQLFSMFIRDPRHGLGRRDLGRELMSQSGVSVQNVILSGRYDDLYSIFGFEGDKVMFEAARSGNELAKKWLPRYTSGKKAKARAIALMNHYSISVQTYQKLIKVDTVETLLNENKKNIFGEVSYFRRGEINFEHVPSLARIRHSKVFRTIPHYEDYMEKVVKGEAKVNFSTGNAYDIYRALSENKVSTVEADVLWKQLAPLSISCIPIVDVSGSMWSDDAIGKALSIGTFLAENSTYAKNQFITFSHDPKLVKLKGNTHSEIFKNMSRAEWGMNTNLKAVFDLLGKLKSYPEYLVVLSDMEFDQGSAQSKDSLMRGLRAKGINTKIIWWNFNSRAVTVPDGDEFGNIFMSGYSPQMLGLLEQGFDANQYLMKLLENYAKTIAVNA